MNYNLVATLGSVITQSLFTMAGSGGTQSISTAQTTAVAKQTTPDQTSTQGQATELGPGPTQTSTSTGTASSPPTTTHYITQITTIVTTDGGTFTTTTPGYYTIATYESSLYYYTTSGNHESIVCTETLTQETVLKVTASNQKDAQSSFASMLQSIENQA